ELRDVVATIGAPRGRGLRIAPRCCERFFGPHISMVLDPILGRTGPTAAAEHTAEEGRSMSEPNIPEIVRDKYAKAALKVTSGEGGCCGTASSRAGCDPVTGNLYATEDT